MRKSVKYVAALLAATMTIGGLTGCVNSASSDTGSNTAASDSNAGVEESASSDNDYDFYIFNAKGENADALAAAVDTYEAETGLTIKYSPWEAVHLQKRHSVSICHRIINRLFWYHGSPGAERVG